MADNHTSYDHRPLFLEALPTGSEAPLDWLAPSDRSSILPFPTDCEYCEVVQSTGEHPAQQASGWLRGCDGQLVVRSPLQVKGVMVPGGGTSPGELHRVIGWAVFDGHLGGGLWSCGRYTQRNVRT